MEFQDYYQSLGVARDASPEDIKRSYRKLARRYHPDVSQEVDAENRFKEVAEAYAVLSDPEKRDAYDRLGPNWRAGQDFQPPPEWPQGQQREFTAEEAAQFSDFFDSLFGGRQGRRGPAGAGASSVRMRGQDQHAAIEISLEEAYHGTTRQLSLQTPELDAQGHWVARERHLDVRIPAGVRAGQQIRLAGQGGPGIDAPAGDLYLEVRLRPHPRYRVDGRDLSLDVPVAPWEAALGGEIEVDTLGGRIQLTVPANSANGRRMRLKGRGLPGQPSGDLYIVLQVVLPPANTPKARELYEAMARELAFNPRG
ncbi:MAG: DnaJ domain-containing protein [Pigmentiphaga sp.]|nr:DnaJ domain-containing protein [Pigmentiphaga sp.]